MSWVLDGDWEGADLGQLAEICVELCTAVNEREALAGQEETEWWNGSAFDSRPAASFFDGRLMAILTGDGGLIASLQTAIYALRNYYCDGERPYANIGNDLLIDNTHGSSWITPWRVTDAACWLQMREALDKLIYRNWSLEYTDTSPKKWVGAEDNYYDVGVPDDRTTAAELAWADMCGASSEEDMTYHHDAYIAMGVTAVANLPFTTHSDGGAQFNRPGSSLSVDTSSVVGELIEGYLIVDSAASGAGEGQDYTDSGDNRLTLTWEGNSIYAIPDKSAARYYSEDWPTIGSSDTPGTFSPASPSNTSIPFGLTPDESNNISASAYITARYQCVTDISSAMTYG